MMTYTEKISRKKLILGNLLLNGLTLPEFAEIYGFEYHTVYRVISRYFGDQEPKEPPRGEKTVRIIKLLEPYLN